MKIKRISKSSVKIFLTSLFLTVFFILSIAAFIVTEKNSLKTGVRQIKEPLSLYCSQKEICLTVNDRELKFSVQPVLNALKSREFSSFALVFLAL